MPIQIEQTTDQGWTSVMNPPPQFPPPPPPPPPPSSSSYTFLPPPPNPNPYFFPSHLPYQYHHPSSTSTTNPITPLPPPPPPPDLATALSTLKDLIRLSESTLHSISTLFPTTTITSSSTSLSPCPFNFHHRLPPESLFCHSLQCPSPLDLDPVLLESLRYPTTLQSSHQLIKQNRFVQTLPDPAAAEELCFSLDEYCDFASPNFFYKDCPGVVSSADQPSTARTFTLPGILSAECANFTGKDINSETKGIYRDFLKLELLPSELWLIRSEIEAWNDYPTTYSYSVLRAILRTLVVEENDFLGWVIVNSPRYGVVIDVPMRDHIVLLFQLCLKAIVREANRLMDFNSSGIRSFKCPILGEALKWLSFQFSVLYGEVNGKFFAVNMLKQWILNALLDSSLFLFVRESHEPSALGAVDGKSAEPIGKAVVDEGNSLPVESIKGRVVFVSQVAAAVAALHERSLLEQKIKAIRDTRPLTKYQRIAEHAYFSKWADEERHKRTNYRPLLENDGLSWQQPRNQETNKTKTREELLAEERDYKRRRMSYRGKKMKRSTTQVMRDIIEKYMEDITQAGGIGCCLVKGAEEGGKFISEPHLLLDITTNVDGLNSDVYKMSEMAREGSNRFKEKLHSHNDTRSKRFDYESPDDHKRRRRDSSRHHEHLEARKSVDRDRRDREYYSKSPDRQRSNGRSEDFISNRGHRDSHSRSHERTNRRRDQGDWYSEMKDKQQRHANRDRRSESVTSYQFEDRYDPSESRNIDEDDISFGATMPGRNSSSQK